MTTELEQNAEMNLKTEVTPALGLAMPVLPKPVPRARRQDAPPWMQLRAFRDLPDTAIERLLEVMQTRRYVPGAPLMVQGDPGDGLLVLTDGSVLVTVRDDLTGGVFERSMNAPAILGEAAVLTGERRTATVSAVTPVTALFLDAATLRLLCSRFPSTAEFLTTLVGERLMASDSIKRVGKYEVRGRLGSGGVATVFAAMHPGLGREVALKMLSHTLIFDRAFAVHFAQEARLVAQLDHENIVRVLDTERAYGTQFIVMEKLTGEELRTPPDGGATLAWPAIRRILVQVLDALAYSHARGLIHRDIKPSNVFMTREGKVKLLDFGIAAQAGTPAESDGKVIGTPAYMSPEQCQGLPLDGRSDMYSLGILAFELCTGQRPFADAHTADAQMRAHSGMALPDPRDLVSDIPEDLAVFIERTTRKRPADRFPTCSDAVDFLRKGDDLVGDAHGVATMAVSFPLGRETQIHDLILSFAAQLREVRGVQVAIASDRAGILEGNGRPLPTHAQPTRTTRKRSAKSLRP